MIIAVGTVTMAIKSRKLLSRAGIRSRAVKIDGNTTTGGCAHALEIDKNNLYDAVRILRENDINCSVHDI